MSKREQIEAQIQALRLQIENLEKEALAAELADTPWAIVDVEEKGHTVDVYFDGYVKTAKRYSENDLNVFKNESTAKGFANAFHVMIALRQCEGAGQYDYNGGGFMINNNGYLEHYYGGSYFSLFPPFQTIELANAAADKVGRDKIVAAYKFLATGE